MHDSYIFSRKLVCKVVQSYLPKSVKVLVDKLHVNILGCNNFSILIVFFFLFLLIKILFSTFSGELILRHFNLLIEIYLAGIIICRKFRITNFKITILCL